VLVVNRGNSREIDALVDRAKALGGQGELIVYPGAGHGFDFPIVTTAMMPSPAPSNSFAASRRRNDRRIGQSFSAALKIASFVMAGLVPAIHVFGASRKLDVDARDRPGRDEVCRTANSVSHWVAIARLVH